MEDLQRSKRLADRTVFGMKLGHNYSRSKKKTNELAELAEESAKLQAARRNKGTHEVVDRWQRWLQGDCWSSSDTGKTLLMLCHALRRKEQANLRQLTPLRNRQFQKRQEHAEQWSDNIWTTSPKKKEMWGVFTVAWYTIQFYWRSYANTWSQSRSG